MGHATSIASPVPHALPLPFSLPLCSRVLKSFQRDPAACLASQKDGLLMDLARASDLAKGQRQFLEHQLSLLDSWKEQVRPMSLSLFESSASIKKDGRGEGVKAGERKRRPAGLG